MPQARSSAAENQPGTGDLPFLPCVLFLWRKALPSRQRAMGGQGGNELNGKLLQELRAVPGADHISSVQGYKACIYALYP